GTLGSSRRTSARRQRMLRLDGIQAGYDGTQVLWDVTLSAEKGAMTVLIGPNGAGKSTTLKVVNGLVRPNRGHVSFQGEDITRTPAHERPGKGIAACPDRRLRLRQAERPCCQVRSAGPVARPRGTPEGLLRDPLASLGVSKARERNAAQKPARSRVFLAPR